MDENAIWSCQEKELEQLGLVERGHIISLKGFCMPKVEDSLEEKAYLVSSIKNAGKQRTQSARSGKEPQPKKARNNRTVQLGWKNYDAVKKEYVPIRKQMGGGTRSVSVAKSADVNTILNIAKELFFENGEASFFGSVDDYKLVLGNFHGQEMDCKTFTLTTYIEKHKLTKTFLYLLTKKRATVAETISSLQPLPLSDDEDNKQNEVDDNGDNNIEEFQVVEPSRNRSR